MILKSTPGAGKRTPRWRQPQFGDGQRWQRSLRNGLDTGLGCQNLDKKNAGSCIVKNFGIGPLWPKIDFHHQKWPIITELLFELTRRRLKSNLLTENLLQTKSSRSQNTKIILATISTIPRCRNLDNLTI
jgi:hypothetical protein